MCDDFFLSRVAVLIDPECQLPHEGAKNAIAAVMGGARLILVGGSTSDDVSLVDRTVEEIQLSLEEMCSAASQDPSSDENYWRVPVLLFPNTANALSSLADGVLFMSLLNSKSIRYIISEQIIGAPLITEFGIESLPTAYVICAPGMKAGEVGEADLVMPSDVERIRALALTAKGFGMKFLYLEAGSGSPTPVSPELIKSANVDGLTILVGGGITNSTSALAAANSGAHWIVIGTVIEESENASAIQKRVKVISDAIQSSSKSAGGA